MKRLSPAQTSPLLKCALRAAFPETKFSVTLSRGTAYGNCHVNWKGGPSSEEVEVITEPFSSQGFDGMTDSTTFKKTRVLDRDGNEAESGISLILIERQRDEESDEERHARYKEIGAKAFADGLPAVPAQDGAIMFEITKLAPHEDSVSLLDAWIAGWTEANLAAPLPEDPQIEQDREREQYGCTVDDMIRYGIRFIGPLKMHVDRAAAAAALLDDAQDELTRGNLDRARHMMNRAKYLLDGVRVEMRASA